MSILSETSSLTHRKQQKPITKQKKKYRIENRPQSDWIAVDALLNARASGVKGLYLRRPPHKAGYPGEARFTWKPLFLEPSIPYLARFTFSELLTSLRFNSFLL